MPKIDKLYALIDQGVNKETIDAIIGVANTIKNDNNLPISETYAARFIRAYAERIKTVYSYADLLPKKTINGSIDEHLGWIAEKRRQEIAQRQHTSYRRYD